MGCRSTRCAASSCAPARSIEPSSVNGVTMAVSTRPNGRAGSVVMGRIYPADRDGPVRTPTPRTGPPDDDVDQPSSGVRVTRRQSVADGRRPRVPVDEDVDLGDHQPVGVRQEAGVDRPRRSPRRTRARRAPAPPTPRAVRPRPTSRRSDVRTTLVRPGSGRNRSGSDSQVRRPMTTVEPMVRRRKSARSSGRCQGSPPSAPITPSRACAQTMPTVPALPPFTPPRLP